MYLTDLSALALFIIREFELISAMAQYNLDPKAATDFASVFTIQKYFTDIVGLSLALELQFSDINFKKIIEGKIFYTLHRIYYIEWLLYNLDLEK